MAGAFVEGLAATDGQVGMTPLYLFRERLKMTVAFHESVLPLLFPAPKPQNDNEPSSDVEVSPVTSDGSPGVSEAPPRSNSRRPNSLRIKPNGK